MKQATSTDKDIIIEILVKSFDANSSVNYIIKQDENREKRLNALMNYSFQMCMMFGEVFLSGDNKACALIMYPDKKKMNLRSILLDLKLIVKSVGFANIKKTLRREKLINDIQPKILRSYLWFIGVNPEAQNQGVGSKFLQEIINNSNSKNRPMYLETSTVKNLPWYKKFGFEVYHKHDLPYQLYFFKRDVK